MKDRKWVVNASPIIMLGKVSKLSLIIELCKDIVIPEAVYQEINAGPAYDPALKWLKKAGKKWLYPSIEVHPDIASWDLGSGESEVLSFSLKNPGFTAIIDDRAARNCAKSFSIPFIGTIGVVLLAKKENKLPQIKPILDQLIKSDIRINPEILRRALALAAEE